MCCRSEQCQKLGQQLTAFGVEGAADVLAAGKENSTGTENIDPSEQSPSSTLDRDLVPPQNKNRWNNAYNCKFAARHPNFNSNSGNFVVKTIRDTEGNIEFALGYCSLSAKSFWLGSAEHPRKGMELSVTSEQTKAALTTNGACGSKR